jgi:hypothetical protein
MILRFKGNLSQGIIDMILKDHVKAQRLIILFGIVLGIPFCFLCVSMVGLPWQIGLIMSIWIVLFLTIANEISLKKDYPAHLIPVEVEISVDEDSIYVENEKGNTAKDLSSVKEVKDYGDWYFISFGRKLLITGYVCQKDLLVEGTLEDFERIFEGKIKKA